VGGGAGGVELALAMQSHLHQVLKAAQQPLNNLEIHLFHGDAELMPNYRSWCAAAFRKFLTRDYAASSEVVCEVQAHKVNCESGLKVECDHIFWVTQASPAG